MLEHISTLRPFNNDRPAHMAAFRPATQTIGAAIPALPSVAPPPTIDTEAHKALTDVRQEMDAQGAPALGAVHSGLDAERVARLLGLLD